MAHSGLIAPAQDVRAAVDQHERFDAQAPDQDLAGGALSVWTPVFGKAYTVVGSFWVAGQRARARSGRYSSVQR